MNYNAETYICYGKKENRVNRRSGQSTPRDERRDVGPLAFLEHSFDNLDNMGMSLSDIIKLTVGLSSWSRKSTDVPAVNCSKERDCSIFARVAWSSFSFSLPSLSLWQPGGVFHLLTYCFQYAGEKLTALASRPSHVCSCHR